MAIKPTYKRLSVFLGTVVAIGVLLMIATALIVYYGFCLEKEVFVETPVPIPPVANHAVLRCNCPDHCLKKPYMPCPTEKPVPCPVHPLLQTTPNPHACNRPCHSCTQQNECQTSRDECREQYQALWQPKYPPMRKEEELKNSTVLQWVSMYPVNSPERLWILTQLMEYGVEPYVTTMTRRSCKEGLPFDLCTFCQDRYEFLRSAMKTKVKTNKYGYKTSNKMSRMTKEFKKDFALNAYWYSLDWFDYLTREHFKNIIANYQAFHFVADNGEECSWCNDFDHMKYVLCINPPRTRN